MGILKRGRGPIESEGPPSRFRWLLGGAAAVLISIAVVSAGCGSWTGGGFRADGPELPRLRSVLMLGPGTVVADVGAGKGDLTFALAREVGPKGHVFATEIDSERLRALREALVAGKLNNVTVIDASGNETGLSPNCCDAIVLRRVYHHLTDPSGINASLLRSLRPGGVLAVIDFAPPPLLGRGDLGVPQDVVVAEVKSRGFELLRLINDWPGRGPLDSYCAVFRKPA
jgi:ubiquinone/menaquinone biosynthesis C-methylase UbiE